MICECQPMFPDDVRYELASSFMRGLPETVFVGSHGNEMSVGRLWVIDEPGAVASFEESFKPRGQYGVVCLGLDMDDDQDETDALVRLCTGAELVVLEWATEREEAVIDPSLLVNGRERLVDIRLDLPRMHKSDCGDGTLRTFQAWL